MCQCKNKINGIPNHLMEQIKQMKCSGGELSGILDYVDRQTGYDKNIRRKIIEIYNNIKECD